MKTAAVISALVASQAVAQAVSARADDRSGVTVSGAVSMAAIESERRVAFAGALGYRLNRIVGVELELAAIPGLDSRFPGAVDQPSPGPFFTNFGGRAVVLAVDARVSVPTRLTAVDPFVLVGVGVASVRHTADFTFLGPPPLEPPQVSSAEVDRVWTGGGGVGFRVAPKAWVDAELRLGRLARETRPNVYRFGLGMRYRF